MLSALSWMLIEANCHSCRDKDKFNLFSCLFVLAFYGPRRSRGQCQAVLIEHAS